MSRPIVAITRPADRSKAACKIVEELGGQYVLAPTLDLKPVNSESLKNLISNKDLLDWIVFTSPTTITSLNLFYPDFLKNLDCKVAVIGNKTGKIAGEQGVKVDLIPEDFTAEGLLEEFEKRNITNQTIGIPRTASARPVLPEGLEKLNNKVIVAEAYKSLFPMDEDKINDLIAKIENITKENNKLIITTAGDPTENCLKTTKSVPSIDSLCWNKIENNKVESNYFAYKKYYTIYKQIKM